MDNSAKRISRKVFIRRIIILYGILWILLIAKEWASENTLYGEYLFIVPLFYVSFSICSSYARRLHDFNASHWWCILGLIPLVNWIFTIFLILKKGSSGPNRYGPQPNTTN